MFHHLFLRLFLGRFPTRRVLTYPKGVAYSFFSSILWIKVVFKAAVDSRDINLGPPIVAFKLSNLLGSPLKP
ncbi:hypothetical protein AFLA_005935 [Aspergillus flavus NRRL3357]|nr:hypothetical protein AFLA_005935 [Aspergillus flavus NRRL3357]